MNATQLGGGLLGGEDEVALVLAVLVVDHDHGPAGGDVGDARSTVSSLVIASMLHVYCVPLRSGSVSAVKQRLHVLRDDVDLEVDRVADPP